MWYWCYFNLTKARAAAKGIVLLLPRLWQNFHSAFLVPGLPDMWLHAEMDQGTHPVESYSFKFLLFCFPVISVPSSHLLHSHTNIHAETGQKVGRWEGGHVASHPRGRKTWPGQQPSPTDTLQAMLPLNCALSHGEVRNVGLCASNLLYLLVVPQFIYLFY